MALRHLFGKDRRTQQKILKYLNFQTGRRIGKREKRAKSDKIHHSNVIIKRASELTRTNAL